MFTIHVCSCMSYHCDVILQYIRDVILHNFLPMGSEYDDLYISCVYYPNGDQLYS